MKEENGKKKSEFGVRREGSDYRPISLPGHFDEFMEGVVYKDFIGEIDCRIEQLRSVLENEDGKTYIKVQGGLRMLREIKDIFEDLKINRVDDLNAEASTREGEDNG